MARAKYIWSGNEKFINPYNFVSVPLHGNKNKQTHDSGEKLHTGVLHCSLITKTPIAVPDISESSSKSNGHMRYDFFHYEKGFPVIPGSTLHGSVRSMYEALSDSCFSTARADSVITTRGMGTFRPGVLKKRADGKWELYRAERYLIEVYLKNNEEKSDLNRRRLLDEYGFGTKIFFKSRDGKNGRKYVVWESLSKEGQKTSQGCKEGYLYVGERIAEKRFESAFVISDNKAVAIVQDKEIQGLLQTIDVYQDETVNKNLNKNHEGYTHATQAFKRGIVPIWFKQNGKRTYLSMACIGRTAYQKNMGELLDKRAACTTEDLCKACSLFGMASENYKSGSKVRITDAKVLNRTETERVTLRELSSPHSSYLPFYATKNEDSKNWSYDTNANIRGRKFYWHSTSEYYDINKDARVSDEEKETKRNATMDLVKSGVVFEFKVYYDRITEEQLNELMWTLTLGENNEESSYCYKIGHGKPIGLGSVKICVNRREERIFGADGYQVVDAELGDMSQNPFAGSPTVRQVLDITNMETVEGERVEYPRVIPVNGVRPNDKAAHQWFGKNYMLGSKMKVNNYLPAISGDVRSLRLPALEVRQDTSNNK